MSTSQTALQKNNEADSLQMYGSYPFSTDETYQQGLASILGGGTLDPNSSEDVKDEMLRRTRVFYFNKVTGSTIGMDEAREYELSLLSPTIQSTEEATETNEESRFLTFAELKELIETGNMDKIPNNKIIPEGLNDAIPSESIAQTRKKPWETEASAEN